MVLKDVTTFAEFNYASLDDILQFVREQGPKDVQEFKTFASTPVDENGELPNFFTLKAYIQKKYFPQFTAKKPKTMLDKIMEI